MFEHESGHAIDYCLGYFTQSTEFKQAYFFDAAKVPDEYRQRLDYFLQRSDSGPSETFAELFCYRLGGETDSRQQTCELVHKYFPLSEKAMEKRLAARESKSRRTAHSVTAKRARLNAMLFLVTGRSTKRKEAN